MRDASEIDSVFSATSERCSVDTSEAIAADFLIRDLMRREFQSCLLPSFNAALPSSDEVIKVVPSMSRLQLSGASVDRLLAALLAIAAFMVFTFIRAADEVFEKNARRFDEMVLLAFRSHADQTQPGGPAWLPDVMRDFTALGNLAVLTMIVLGCSVFLAFAGKRKTAVFILLAVVIGILVEHIMKSGYGRPRPDLVPHGELATSWSFPSGHAMNAAVVYLTLGNLLAQTQRRVSIKAILIGFSVFLSILVDVSNLYLGVRWPTDAMAGWMLGLSWAIVCWFVLHALQGRALLEPETP